MYHASIIFKSNCSAIPSFQSGDTGYLSLFQVLLTHSLSVTNKFVSNRGHRGTNSKYRCLASKGYCIVEIRRLNDLLISTMWYPILIRRCLCIESAPVIQIIACHLYGTKPLSQPILLVTSISFTTTKVKSFKRLGYLNRVYDQGTTGLLQYTIARCI